MRLHLALAAKEGERLAGRHVEHFGDVAAAILHVEHLPAIAPAVALGALHVHVGHELHVDRQVAVAVARLAAAAFDVEAEMAGREARGPAPPAARQTAARIGSNALMYVAGFERGERPIGLWSM